MHIWWLWDVQEYLRGFFVIASIGFFLAFAIQSSTNQGDTDAKVRQSVTPPPHKVNPSLSMG